MTQHPTGKGRHYRGILLLPIRSDNGISNIRDDENLYRHGGVGAERPNGRRRHESIMGMDDVDIAALFVPSLTTIRQPFERMCELAVSYLLDPDRDQNKTIVLEPERVVRKSVADITGT